MRLKITQLLADLNFTEMVNALPNILDTGLEQGHSVEEILWRLLSEEARDRQEKSLAYRIKQARLPWDWTLETFPFKHQPGVNISQIRSLAGLEFIKRAQIWCSSARQAPEKPDWPSAWPEKRPSTAHESGFTT